MAHKIAWTSSDDWAITEMQSFPYHNSRNIWRIDKIQSTNSHNKTVLIHIITFKCLFNLHSHKLTVLIKLVLYFVAYLVQGIHNGKLLVRNYTARLTAIFLKNTVFLGQFLCKNDMSGLLKTFRVRSKGNKALSLELRSFRTKIIVLVDSLLFLKTNVKNRHHSLKN